MSEATSDAMSEQRGAMSEVTSEVLSERREATSERCKVTSEATTERHEAMGEATSERCEAASEAMSEQHQAMSGATSEATSGVTNEWRKAASEANWPGRRPKKRRRWLKLWDFSGTGWDKATLRDDRIYKG